MGNFVAWMVASLLVGPPLIFLAGALLFLVASMLPDTPRLLRHSFWCPFKARPVTVDFLVPMQGTRATAVEACSAFAGGPVRCRGACRDLTDVRWGASRALFPRWALTAGGPVYWRKPEGSST